MGSATDDKFVGRTLPGGHHILDLISVGGMGRVYRAEQSVLGRTVAVKIIHPHLLADENAAVRFLTEARAASQLNHPNSVSVFDFGRTDDGQPYLVMEFLRGKDLARVTYEEGPLSFTRIVDVLRQVLGALGEAHDLGIVHRDLKPENVILEPLRRGGDFVKVVDFGLAKLKADAQSTSITNPGIVCGTPDYMAPEQGRGDEIDGRADLYAVGVILFQLVTGRLPFEADSPTQVVMMHLSIPVPDPRQVAPERDVPTPLVDVIMTALSKDAKHRYQDAHEFAEALRRATSTSQNTPALRPAPPAATDTVMCPSCGQSVPLAKFCWECAAPLPRKGGAADDFKAEFPLAFLGRKADIAWLEERRAALADSFSGARIVADPGLGKTRLIEEFVAGCQERQDFVVATGPDPYWAQVAYHALSNAVRQLARLQSTDIQEARFAGANPDALRGLNELFRGMPRRDDQRSALERRHGLAEALVWALQKAALYAEPHSVVLVIDDLDRVDAPSRWAFADALSEPHNFPALFVAAHVPGFDAGWGDNSSARVLAELPAGVASQLLPAKHHSAQVGDLGPLSPLYIEQIIRYSLEGGTDAPTRIADLIALRVDSLDPPARRALQALAVLGDKTSREAIELLLPKDSDLDATIEALVASGMANESDTQLRASHPLLREIVLGGIPVAVRRELHKKALRVLEQGAAPIETSALHAYFAQDSLQALLLLEQVADRASTRGDSISEVFALRRGLEVARQEIARGQLDDPLRAVLIFSRKLGASLTRAGNFADAEGVLREALDIAGPSGADRAKLLSALAHVAHGRHRSSEALGYIDQAISAAENSNEHGLASSLTDTRRAWAS
jgi:serine/threonine-protein kinase